MSPQSEGFDELKRAIEQTTNEKVDRKVDRYVTAALDDALDALGAADGLRLSQMSEVVKDLHDGLIHDGGRYEAVYLAGRLGTLAEMLGLASERSAHPELEAALERPALRPIVTALGGGAKRNVDLTKIVGQSEETVCRKLQELREVGAVASYKRGRDVFNALTPLVASIVGNVRRKGAGGQANVFDLQALVARMKPTTEPDFIPVPRLSNEPVRALENVG